MGNKQVHEDKLGRVQFLNRKKKKQYCVNARRDKNWKCKEKLVEYFCSCCMLCVCCPLATVCCCLMLPCRVFKKVLRWACCFGSKNRIFADYSSFSDIDQDVAFDKVIKFKPT
jgi:hypothetical protein